MDKEQLEKMKYAELQQLARELERQSGIDIKRNEQREQLIDDMLAVYKFLGTPEKDEECHEEAEVINANSPTYVVEYWETNPTDWRVVYSGTDRKMALKKYDGYVKATAKSQVRKNF